MAVSHTETQQAVAERLQRMVDKLQAPGPGANPTETLGECVFILADTLKLLAEEIDKLKGPKYWSNPTRMGG
jgi:hypothetical protein